MQVSDGEVIGFAAEVVDVNKSEIFGKAEENAAAFLRGYAVDGNPCGVFCDLSLKELAQGCFLTIEVCQHQLELCTVFRHEVGLASAQLITTVSYVVYFLGTQLCHLGRAACTKYILGHKVGRIERCRFLCRHKLAHGGLHGRGIGIDCQQLAIGATCNFADAVPLVDGQIEVASGVGTRKGVNFYADNTIGYRRLLADVLLHIPEGILTKATGYVLCLLHFHGKACAVSGQAVRRAFNALGVKYRKR